MVEKLVPDLFLKYQNLGYIWINSLKILFCLFLLYGKLRAIKIYWNKAAYHLLSPHIKLYWKRKRGLELASLPHFRIIFEEKYFSCYGLLIDLILLSGYFYIVRYWTICMLQLFVNQAVMSWILKLTLSF